MRFRGGVARVLGAAGVAGVLTGCFLLPDDGYEKVAYRERLPGFMATFPDRSYTIVELTGGPTTPGDDDTDVVAVRYRFGADVDGHRIDIPGVMWFGIRDGLITRRIDTWDSLTYFRQTEQTPPVPA